MEIDQSLDTQSCLDAVHRFITRKGEPKTVISDNGTNIVGTANELKAAFKELNRFEMQRNLAENGIQRTSNPLQLHISVAHGNQSVQKNDFQYFGQRIFERRKSLLSNRILQQLVAMLKIRIR